MPLKNNKKVIAVLPAYNAAKTLQNTLNDIPQELVDDIILVDDASQDGTVELARKLGLKTFVHKKNLGYGGNQKTCYREALNLGADIVIMIHPDHQYDPTYVAEILQPLLKGESDAVFGSRMMKNGDALRGGMPYWKCLANIVLTKIGNIMLGSKLTEFHSGFRAYSKKTLESIPYQLNSNNFVFDTEIIIQLVSRGLKIKEIPIPTRYFKEASSIGFLASSHYGISLIAALVRHKIHQLNIKKYNQFN